MDQAERRGEMAATVGLSLDPVTRQQVEALLGVKPGRQERSRRYRTVLEAGMEALYGSNWRVRADAIIRGLESDQ